ncbi:MAG: substrate-binding domain-containing protein [Lachnospiraceae bacterium]|nr:substrate-binding domain-containing protein [Lachnospiraceae bacterium]
MKRLKALLLTGVLAMSFAFGGCGGDTGAAGTTGSGDSGTTTTTTTTDTGSAGGTIKVGVVNNPPSESGYREANVKDMESVFSKENGYDLKTAYSLKNDEQLQAAQGFITEGVDYLLISAAETTGWDEVLKSAKEAGIKVYLFDRMIDVDESLYEAAVVSDMSAEGKTAVDWLLAQNLPEYKVIHIQGAMGSDAQIGRTGALDEQFASGKMTKVVQQTATWDEAEAKKIVESVINSGEDFNVIYAENDGMAKGAVAALDEHGITHGVDGKVIVMGFDCNKWALRELLAGKWNYDGQCSPFQAQIISDLIQGKTTASSKKIINEEKGFDAKELTQADIDTYGLGE